MFSLVESFRGSNLSCVAFCKQQGIPMWKFQYWQKKYRQINSSVSDGFVELISTRGKVKTPDLGKITLQYPNGINLQLPAGTPLSTIRTLLTLV